MAAERSQQRCFLILRCRLFLSLHRSRKVSDCAPANRERELGSDRRGTASFYSTGEFDAATVVDRSQYTEKIFDRIPFKHNSFHVLLHSILNCTDYPCIV